ncbi:hypothetical protein [Streptomyces vinaceus]|uniref:hypothetical protein n=1 Tax=Streptomyces vinaceus TaxID=1960 RepID=UPI001E310391|nr:hypothetical protein [Streptomyces vinaceus]
MARTPRTRLAVLGATMEHMEPWSDLKLDQRRRVERVHEVLAEHPEYHWMRQYHDAAPAGSVDLLRRHAVFAGLSTGAGYLADLAAP